MRSKLVLSVQIALVANAAFLGCSSNPSTPGPYVFSQKVSGNVSSVVFPAGAARANLRDSYAPDFRWRRADSTLDSLSNHTGQVVLVNFWATWCGPCTSEMPNIQAAQKTMSDSLFVIGVSVDGSGNVFDEVRNYVQSNHYSYQFAIDSLYTLYFKYLPNTNFAIPQSFFIDPAGQIAVPVTGEMNAAQVLQFARQAAAQ